MLKKIVLAYSGGLDTSIILSWLIDKGYSVRCYIGDVGQQEDFEKAKQKALNLGADDVFIDLLQEEFVRDYLFEALKANALYEGRYLLGTALARPVIAKGIIRYAEQNGICCISHGATGKGNDQIRFELVAKQLMPSVEILAPWRMPQFLKQFKGRSDLIEYAKEKGIPISSKSTYSMDSNLMHVSYEGGILEDPSQPYDEEMFQMTTSPFKASEKPAKVSITFEKGVPVDVNGIKGAVPILKYLNEAAGQHGIGRIDIVENRMLGIKSRGVYETPGATLLFKAHHDLDVFCIDREVFHLKEMLAPKIAELIYNGLWFSPEMQFLMAAIKQSQESVNGVVEMLLYKGNALVIGRSSPSSPYNQQLASMDEEGDYSPQHAEGFIQCQALRFL